MYSRREFLKSSSASLIALAGVSSPLLVPFSAMAESGVADSVSKGRELLLMCDTDHAQPQMGSYAPIPGRVCAFDVKSGDEMVIETPFYGHTVNQNAVHLEQVASIQKWGTLGAILNIKSKSIINFIHAVDSRMFFGHCLFSADGKTLVCTEANIDEKDGLLVLRSVPDMKIIGQMSSYGKLPHECHSFNGGKTIVTANCHTEAGFGNVAWVDFQSGKLLKKVTFDKQNFAPSHMDMSHDGWFCFGGRQYNKDPERKDAKDLISFISPSGEVFIPKIPDDISKRSSGEALSISFVGKTGLVAITIPESNLLLMINYKKQTLVEAFDLKFPKGVLGLSDEDGNQSGVFVSVPEAKELLTILCGKNQKTSSGPVYKNVRVNGSHMTRGYI